MDPLNMRDIVGILMGSAFYFDLNLKERHSLIRHILELSTPKPGRDKRVCASWHQYSMSVPLSML